MLLFTRNPRAWALAALVIAGTGLFAFPKSDAGGGPGESEPASLAAGTALVERGAYEEAIAHFRGELSRPDLKVSERIGIYRTLGYILLYVDRNEEAIRNSQTAQNWAAEQGLQAEVALFKTELAVQQAYIQALALRASRDFSKSNAKFEEAYRLAGSAACRPFRLKIAGAWSVNYMMGSKDGQARYLELNLRALELANSLNVKLEASRAANRIGTFYAIRNDYSRALSFFLRALNYLKGTLDNGDMIAYLNNVAVEYGLLGDYVKARDYLMHAVSQVPEGSTKAFDASVLLNLGTMFGGQGRRLKSDDLLQRALDCFNSFLGLKSVAGGGRLRLDALTEMAGVYIEQGRLDDARKVLGPALEEAGRTNASPLTVGKLRALLGILALRTGDAAAARKYFEETSSISDESASPLLKMNAVFGLGQCAEALGDHGLAIENYNLALEIVGEGFSGIVSDIHRAEFIGRSLKPFQALVNLYLKLSRTGNKDIYDREMFRLSEYLRARSFMEFRDRLSRNPQPPAGAPEGPDEAALGRERTRLLKSLSQGSLGREERERIRASLVQLDDLLDAKVVDRYDGPADRTARPPRPIPLDVLQDKVLDDRTAVLEYLLGEPASVLFCITKGSLRVVELPPASDLRDALTGYLSFLEDPSMPVGKGLPAARRLYQSLLGPAEPFLPAGVDRLIIVPDGMLFRLPFEALVLPAASAAKPVYVNDRFVVSYAPSASSLDLPGADQDIRYAKGALAFGVSKYPRPDRRGAAAAPLSPSAILDDIYGRRGFEIGSIPHVGEEIADLARRLPPDRIDAFEGPKATEKALKGLDLKAYRLIHLACHAFSDDNNPLRSALLLAPGADDEEDGYLQVSEMYNLGTNADLVVLSACQTGRGTIVMNEGNLGLPRVFFYMGARSVLSTLWPVYDNAGATFMKSFYDAYFDGQGKAEAVRAAKKAMQGKGFSHPFYWAPYVLTGGF